MDIRTTKDTFILAFIKHFPDIIQKQITNILNTNILNIKVKCYNILNIKAKYNILLTKMAKNLSYVIYSVNTFTISIVTSN